MRFPRSPCRPAKIGYTNCVYFAGYYWEGDDFYYDLNRADTLTLGAGFRF
jgi:hypothetical protein